MKQLLQSTASCLAHVIGRYAAEMNLLVWKNFQIHPVVDLKQVAKMPSEGIYFDLIQKVDRDTSIHHDSVIEPKDRSW